MNTVNNRQILNKLSVARLGSGIGALSLIAAILIFLIQREVTAAVFLAAIIGVIGLTLWLTLAPDDLRAMISERQALYGGNSLLVSVLVIGIVAILYTFAAAANITADLTAYRVYSLRPDVDALVKSLTEPSIITVFYTTAQLDQQSRDVPILRLFTDASSGKIKINQVDPEQNPVVAQKFGATLSQHAFITGVTADGQPDIGVGKIVTLNNDVVGEQQIADALLLLQARGKFRVLFTTGHGELNTDTNTNGEATAIRNGLTKVGITTDTLDLSTQDIPQSTTALVMLSPIKDLPAAEVDKIGQYMGNGGRLLVMARPLLYENTNAPTAPLAFTFLQESSPMTKYLWDEWGIRAQNNIVFDPGSYVSSPVSLLTYTASKHQIMAADQANTKQLKALLVIARSLELAPQSQHPDVTHIPLIGTSDKAFGATNIRSVQVNADKYIRTDKDMNGPFVLAAAAQNTKNNSRLVIIGESSWATNDIITESGNALLWSNMMDWLTQFLEKTTVSPTVSPLPLSTDTGTLNSIVVVTLIILPGIILALGGFVWWDRARR